MKTQQPFLGQGGTLMFLVIISAFPPLTTDLYLPALPHMAEVFNTNQSMINLTLSAYFVVYALGLLFWGPLSEKLGRKPVVHAGFGLYVLASLWCVLVGSVESLIAARMLQAFGGSAITVVATAIVKDLYTGRERERIMATIMSLVVIAPMVAPIVGAVLLKFSSWRMIFVSLALFGTAAGLIALLFRETLTQRYTGSTFESWGRIFVVLKNPDLVLLLATFSTVPMAMMAFIASGAYIYVDEFHLTEQQFSCVFALNALFASIGPRIYIKLNQSIPTNRIISACFLLLCLFGALVYSYGQDSPWLLSLLIAPATLAAITTRVPGVNLILDQQEQDTGSVVAIVQFSSMIFGAIGMTLVSLDTGSLIKNLGSIQFLVGASSLTLWLLAKKRIKLNSQKVIS